MPADASAPIYPARALVVAVLGQAVVDVDAWRRHGHRVAGVACLCPVARDGAEAAAWLRDITAETPWSVRWCLRQLALDDLRALRAGWARLALDERPQQASA